jgi:hypothetical protein
MMGLGREGFELHAQLMGKGKIAHTPDLYLLFASSTDLAGRIAVLLNALRAPWMPPKFDAAVRVRSVARHCVRGICESIVGESAESSDLLGIKDLVIVERLWLEM